MTCPACGVPVPEGARFCPDCGQRLVVAADERRRVTVLMADLVGFTALSATSDPEQVKRLVDACFEQLVNDITHFGGRLDKIVGDEIVAQFGAPVAHEDDAERAVRAALRMHETLAALAPQLGVVVQMRVGVNTGEVLVGALRAGGDPTVMGDVVNTAQRLETLAAPGDVIVGPDTYAATRDAISYEALGPQGLKGRDAPVEAYRAIEAVAPPGRRRARERAPLVGRDVEISALEHVLRMAASRGRAQLVVLSGDAGVGKSRLATELALAAERDYGAATVMGQCVPYGDTNPYGPVAEALRAACGVEGPAADPATRAHLAERVRVGHEPRDRLRRVRAHGRRADVRDRRRGPAGCRSVACARRRGAVDDHVLRVAHHPRAPRAHALRRALGERRGARRVRPHAGAPARPAARARHHDATRPRRALGTRRPGATTRSPSISSRSTPTRPRRWYARCSAAMPTTRPSTSCSNAAAGTPSSWKSSWRSCKRRAITSACTSCPATLHGLVAARLDTLEPAERSVLEDCAVVGDGGPIAAVLSLADRADTRQLLDRLAERDLLTFEHDEFHFKSELIREIAYGTLTKAERARRHAVVAPVFLARGEPAVDHAAHHLATAAELVAELGAVPGVPADVHTQAIDALMRAAERDESVESWLLAERHHDRALGLLGDEPVTERRHALLGRARARIQRRDLDDGARRRAARARRGACRRRPTARCPRTDAARRR